jgi:nicotinamide riboside kinase
MKIYVSGAESGGKSTICRYIREKYKLSMINEVARSVLAEKEINLDLLRTNLDLVDSYQTAIFYKQMEEETKYESFISDRSVIDCLAYSGAYSRVLPQLVSDPKLGSHIAKLKSEKYCIFFVRPQKSIMVADGVRENLVWENMIGIDANIKFLLKMFDLRYFEINTPSMQERINLVDNVLGLF